MKLRSASREARSVGSGKFSLVYGHTGNGVVGLAEQFLHSLLQMLFEKIQVFLFHVGPMA